MSVRAVLFVICLCLAASCKNEPYEHPPLGVVSLLNHVSNVTNTYHYHDQKLYSYLSMAADTVSYMRFYYQGDQLRSIVTDSTKASKKVTSFYRAEGSTVIDSTFLIDTVTTSRLTAVRTVNYDGDSNPVTVGLMTWSDDANTNQLAELTWDNGNVVNLATFDLTTGEKVLVRDLTIAHDDQSCVYMKNRNYLFTLGLSELYWLSKNNPVIFNDGSGEKKYTYWYNKLGYPSNFRNETGVLFGATYTQVR
ncbi:MAG TPA: hypothetical protein VK508_17320 [Cyclobacteriaceae bacterium]|nr:hypothetical protein [Cyclobacteriaceae bacterium]